MIMGLGPMQRKGTEDHTHEGYVAGEDQQDKPKCETVREKSPAFRIN